MQSGAMYPAPVTVISPSARGGPVLAALLRVGIPATPLSLATARRSPAGWLDADLVVCAWAPGAEPAVEGELFARETGALHVAWDGDLATVGPHVVPGLGPCPRCLAATAPVLGDPGGALPGAWAAASAALQVTGILAAGASDLVGASWLWRLRRPGLAVVEHHRRPDCRVAGCVSHDGCG